jgi:hypothetical protein
VRGFGWQVSFLKIALFEWFSEVVLLRSVEIALFDYGLCWLVGDEVEATVRQLEAVAAEVTVGSSAVAEDGGVAVAKDAASVSQEMVRQWPGLPESRWVAGLCSLPPPAVVPGDHHGYRRWWTRLLSRGSLETWEMAVSFGCPLVLAWLVFMYYRFVDGWLTSLSALGQGLAAMTVVLSVISLRVAIWRRRPRVDPGAATSVVPHDAAALALTAPEHKQDDDQTPIDIDDGSWALSLSSSWSSQLLKDSSSSSWQLSVSQSSNRRHGSVSDGCAIVEDDYVEHRVHLDGEADLPNDAVDAPTMVIDMDGDTVVGDEQDDRAWLIDWESHHTSDEYDDEAVRGPGHAMMSDGRGDWSDGTAVAREGRGAYCLDTGLDEEYSDDRHGDW